MMVLYRTPEQGDMHTNPSLLLLDFCINFMIKRNMMVQYFWCIEISPVVSHKIFKTFYIDIKGK